MNMQISDLLDAYEQTLTTPRAVITAALEKCDRVAPEVWIKRLTLAEIEPYLTALEGQSPATRPLFGIPFVIKDNIDLAGIPTTAGCKEYEYLPEKSAFAVQQLIEAGAIPIAKTNLDQFATGLVGTRSPYGACPNAFDPAYVSGGSSSGSAVAVAEGCCSFSLGTDTAGSGRVPAAFNNLVGLKATRGALSCSGVVPACKSLDCVSIFALDTADAQRVFDVAAQFDTDDEFSIEVTQQPAAPVNWTFGVPRADQLKFFGNTVYETAFSDSLELLKKAGGTAVEIDFSPFLEAANLLYSGPWVNERFAAVGEFITAQPDAVLDTTRTIITSGLAIPAPDVFKSMYQLRKLKRLADAVMDSVDLIVTPTAGSCYTIDAVNADPIQLNTNLGYYTNYMNLLEYSAVAVPTRFTERVPFGVTLVAAAGSDHKLLDIAGEVQAASNVGVGKTTNAPCGAYAPVAATIQVAVCGAHLKGQPLHHQLETLKATFVKTTQTADTYRMYAFESDGIEKPGLVKSETGGALYLEIYALTPDAFGRFVELIPSPLGIGTITLSGGESVKSFIAEPIVVELGTDITAHGDWRVYRNA